MTRRDRDGWAVAEDAGRGWRWVVPSPRPLEILELPVIRQLVDSGTITIAVGGGGIPVVRTPDGTYTGVEAVIDKDRAASLLARSLDADRFVISTAVEKVYLNYGTPEEQAVEEMTVADAKTYMREGHFARGSMLPKIEAMIEFVEATGRQGIITDPEHLASALEAEAGTHIVP
jgi:carbamate kinase